MRWNLRCDACPFEAYLRYLPLSRRSCFLNSSKEGQKFQKFEVFCSELFHSLEEETSASSVLESLGETSGDYKSLSTNSKSGEFFFLSRDRKFLIKTVSEAEGRLLFRMLPEYQDHIHSSPMSLIVRFAGLYRVEIAKGSWKYFLLMMLFLHPAVSFLQILRCPTLPDTRMWCPLRWLSTQEICFRSIVRNSCTLRPQGLSISSQEEGLTFVPLTHQSFSCCQCFQVFQLLCSILTNGKAVRRANPVGRMKIGSKQNFWCKFQSNDDGRCWRPPFRPMKCWVRQGLFTWVLGRLCCNDT